MPLTRKVRRRSGSAGINVPKSLMDLLDVRIGDTVSFEVVGKDGLLLRVVRAPPSAA